MVCLAVSARLAGRTDDSFRLQQPEVAVAPPTPKPLKRKHLKAALEQQQPVASTSKPSTGAAPTPSRKRPRPDSISAPASPSSSSIAASPSSSQTVPPKKRKVGPSPLAFPIDDHPLTPAQHASLATQYPKILSALRQANPHAFNDPMSTSELAVDFVTKFVSDVAGKLDDHGRDTFVTELCKVDRNWELAMRRCLGLEPREVALEAPMDVETEQSSEADDDAASREAARVAKEEKDRLKLQKKAEKKQRQEARDEQKRKEQEAAVAAAVTEVDPPLEASTSVAVASSPVKLPSKASDGADKSAARPRVRSRLSQREKQALRSAEASQSEREGSATFASPTKSNGTGVKPSNGKTAAGPVTDDLDDAMEVDELESSVPAPAPATLPSSPDRPLVDSSDSQVDQLDSQLPNSSPAPDAPAALDADAPSTPPLATTSIKSITAPSSEDDPEELALSLREHCSPAKPAAASLPSPSRTSPEPHDEELAVPSPAQVQQTFAASIPLPPSPPPQPLPTIGADDSDDSSSASDDSDSSDEDSSEEELDIATVLSRANKRKSLGAVANDAFGTPGSKRRSSMASTIVLGSPASRTPSRVHEDEDEDFLRLSQGPGTAGRQRSALGLSSFLPDNDDEVDNGDEADKESVFSEIVDDDDEAPSKKVANGKGKRIDTDTSDDENEDATAEGVLPASQPVDMALEAGPDAFDDDAPLATQAVKSQPRFRLSEIGDTSSQDGQADEVLFQLNDEGTQLVEANGGAPGEAESDEETQLHGKATSATPLFLQDTQPGETQASQENSMRNDAFEQTQGTWTTASLELEPELTLVFSRLVVAFPAPPAATPVINGLMNEALSTPSKIVVSPPSETQSDVEQPSQPLPTPPVPAQVRSQSLIIACSLCLPFSAQATVLAPPRQSSVPPPTTPGRLTRASLAAARARSGSPFDLDSTSGSQSQVSVKASPSTRPRRLSPAPPPASAPTPAAVPATATPRITRNGTATLSSSQPLPSSSQPQSQSQGRLGGRASSMRSLSQLEELAQTPRRTSSRKVATPKAPLTATTTNGTAKKRWLAAGDDSASDDDESDDGKGKGKKLWG